MFWPLAWPSRVHSRAAAPLPGKRFAYRVVVKNHGFVKARRSVATIRLDRRVVVLKKPAGCRLRKHKLVCPVGTLLPAGNKKHQPSGKFGSVGKAPARTNVLRIVVKLASRARKPSRLSAHATVTSVTADSHSADNHDSTSALWVPTRSK